MQVGHEKDITLLNPVFTKVVGVYFTNVTLCNISQPGFCDKIPRLTATEWSRSVRRLVDMEIMK